MSEQMSLEQIIEKLKETNKNMEEYHANVVIMRHKTDTEDDLQKWLEACAYKLRDPEYWF